LENYLSFQQQKMRSEGNARPDALKLTKPLSMKKFDCNYIQMIKAGICVPSATNLQYKKLINQQSATASTSLDRMSDLHRQSFKQ